MYAPRLGELVADGHLAVGGALVLFIVRVVHDQWPAAETEWNEN